MRRRLSALLARLLRRGAPGVRPLAGVDAAAVREARRDNPFDTWASRSRSANAADPALACHRLWQPFPELLIRPKFRIPASMPVFASGSCFAREVEESLAGLGFEVSTLCDEIFGREPLMHDGAAHTGVRPRSYLNRYNTMSMRDEFAHLLGADPGLESGALMYSLGQGAAADLHYSQSLRQADPATTLARRRAVREFLGPRLRRCRLFVLTLGMAECWFDAEERRYLNNTPGPRVLAAFGERLSVRLTRFEEHLAALESLYLMLQRVHGDDFRIVLTVSPVPLERSFLGRDVVLANTYSKSVLRAVAEEFAAFRPNVDYFPSFELVSFASPADAWEWDHRHVRPALVDHIMASFRRHYVEDAPA